LIFIIALAIAFYLLGRPIRHALAAALSVACPVSFDLLGRPIHPMFVVPLAGAYENLSPIGDVPVRLTFAIAFDLLGRPIRPAHRVVLAIVFALVLAIFQERLFAILATPCH
jgi:hypothetical protein